MIDLAEDFFAAALRNGLHHLLENVRGSGSNEVTNGICGEAGGRGGDGLIEDGERIAHGSVASFGEERKSVVVGLNFFPGDEITELTDDIVKHDSAKTEMLAAGADGLRDVLRLRGGEHKNNVVGRFLERL